MLVLYSLIIMAAGLGFSMSRGGWVSGSLGLILYILLLIPFIKEKGRLVSAGIIAGIIILAVATFYFIGLTPIAEKVESTVDQEYLGMRGRFLIWESSFNAVKETPWFGKGPGTFEYHFQEFRPKGIFKRVHFAHSDYIQILFEAGIVGLLFMIILLVERVYPFLFSAYKFYSVKISSSGFDETYTETHCYARLGTIISILVSVTAIIIHSFVDFNLHLTANGLIFCILLGIGMRIAKDLPAEPDKEKRDQESKQP
jgi:O-antigen ligase